jgi:cytochrome bd ubiquinol oxidase subunit II
VTDAQPPYLVPGQLTIAQAAAPASTHWLLLGVAIVMVMVIVPAMELLYYVDQRGALESPEA